MELTITCTSLQIVRSLADAPTPSSPPTSAASACLWEVLAYALCKANLSRQEGERLFAEAGAAIPWAVTHKASPSAPPPVRAFGKPNYRDGEGEGVALVFVCV